MDALQWRKLEQDTSAVFLAMDIKWYYIYKTNNIINQLRCILNSKNGIIDDYINIISNLVSENTALKTDKVKGDNDTEKDNDSEDNK